MSLHILNLSHLAWEKKLFQRPQQLATQFARLGDSASYLSLISMKRYLLMSMRERIIEEKRLFAQNLPFMPWTDRIPLSRWLTMALVRSKANAILQSATPGKRVLWLQNPAYLSIIDSLPHDLLVYDVMDPFKHFKKSDSSVDQREAQLLKRADVVFTGGRSLHSMVQERRPDAHCFPSGIDYPHFSRGAEPGEPARELADIPKPIFGYFGAVDERIDWELIGKICKARRHWHIVFLGPKVLINEIPVKSKNFHWLGAQPYARLPDFLRGFDVCLIPWLVNDLTKFMSPTKTPEYLAAGRPVVSTPIPDVQAEYGEEAFIASEPEEFIRQCTAALRQGAGPAHKPPQSRTWREIAKEMRAIMQEKLPDNQE